MRLLFLLALALILGAAPLHAQETLGAPPGWTAQSKPGATTFVPPDLRAGEKFSVTIYDLRPLNGHAPGEFLRAFAGKVGGAPGQLQAPLQLQPRERAIIGSGVYNGPGQTSLRAVFLGVTYDGANILMTRALFSRAEVFLRYKDGWSALLSAAKARAQSQNAGNLSGSGADVRQFLPRPGGAIVPGVYVGDLRYWQDNAWHRGMRLYLYPNGEYRVCDARDGDFLDEYHDVTGTGTYAYKPASGQLSVTFRFYLDNSNDGDRLCLYGRDAAGQPMIFARDSPSTSRRRCATPGRPRVVSLPLQPARVPTKPNGSSGQQRPAKAWHPRKSRRWSTTTSSPSMA